MIHVNFLVYLKITANNCHPSPWPSFFSHVVKINVHEFASTVRQKTEV